jgi:pimeloyl-ACP methyl ester carboxylesterase
METAYLEYEERGAGPAVCLAHAGVFSSWFAPLFGEAALDRFRVIRPIRPGYGHSPAPTEPRSLAAHARACAELLHRLDVDRAYWVGHSSSCCIGLQLALDEPGLVAGLVLFEPAKPSGQIRAANAATYVSPSMAAARGGDVASAFDIFLRGVGGEGYRPTLLQCLGEGGLASAELESAYFFADELPAIGAWEFGPEEAARVSAPTLVVNGETTRPWFKENVALLAGLLPNARTATVKGADHLTPLIHPAELAALVAGFVDGCTRGDESMVSGSQTTTTARRPT